MSKNLTTNQQAEIIKAQLKTRILLTIQLGDSAETVLRILENDILATFELDGDTYFAGMVKRSEIKNSFDGSVEKVSITVSDINQALQTMIASEGDILTDAPCVLEEVIFNGFPEDWQPSTTYAESGYVSSIVKNSYIYECTTSGTSGTLEPTWVTTIDDTVNDGSIVWTCRSPIIDDPIQLFSGIVNRPRITLRGMLTFDVERTLSGYQLQSPNSTYDVSCYYRFKDERCRYSGGETSCDKTLSRCTELGNSARFGGHPGVPVEMVITN